jgi:hypothetical protein
MMSNPKHVLDWFDNLSMVNILRNLWWL